MQIIDCIKTLNKVNADINYYKNFYDAHLIYLERLKDLLIENVVIDKEFIDREKQLFPKSEEFWSNIDLQKNLRKNFISNIEHDIIYKKLTVLIYEGIYYILDNYINTPEIKNIKINNKNKPRNKLGVLEKPINIEIEVNYKNTPLKDLYNITYYIFKGEIVIYDLTQQKKNELLKAEVYKKEFNFSKFLETYYKDLNSCGVKYYTEGNPHNCLHSRLYREVNLFLVALFKIKGIEIEIPLSRKKKLKGDKNIDRK